MTTERRVFLAPFSNPTAGRWVPAEDAEDELERLQGIWGDIDFGAMDAEGFGGAVDESASVENIIGLDTAIERYGEPFVAFLRWHGGPSASWTVWDMEQQFEDEYVGQYDSAREFAEEFVDSCGYLDQMPEQLLGYFDYDAFARDLMINHYEVDGFYFRSC